jgi:hypothetical protein
MVLKISFAGTVRGKRLYAIYEDRERVFTGTLHEVKRYLVVRTEKHHRRIEAERAYLAVARAV